MSRWSRIAFLTVFMASAVCASAGHIWHDTRVWAVKGPGGYYGLVESQGVGVGVNTPSACETAVCLGPLQFRVPLPAVAVCLVVIGLLIAVPGAFWFFRHRNRKIV